MQFTNLLDDNRAVSPVIGVILMVAITVILAAVIGTFVLGMSDQVGETGPQASFGFDTDSAGTAPVTVTHEQGAQITRDLTLKYTSNSNSTEDVWTGSTADPITAGDFKTTSADVDDGTTLRVIWTSDGGSASTLGKFEK